MSEVLFQGLIAGGVLGAILYGGAAIFRASLSAIEKAKPRLKTALKDTKRNYENITKSNEDKILEIDDVFYEQANKELEENNQSQGLWIKCGVIADGNLSIQKTEYIKQRSKQLSKNNSK